MPKYVINNETKTVIADITKLSDDEFKKVERLMKLGYTIENGTVEAKTVKRLDNDYILDYLKKNDPEAENIYNEIKDQPALDEKKNIKKTKAGKTVKQGFNAGKTWFAKTYPKDEKEIDKLLKSYAKKFDASYKEYSKKDASKMTESEYKRYFYWTQIFERKENK